MVLLRVNDFIQIANPTLLVSDISLIFFSKLSPKSNFGWSPWLKDNWLCLYFSSGIIFALRKLNVSKLVCLISMAVSAHNLIPLFVTSIMLVSWFSSVTYYNFVNLATTIPDYTRLDLQISGLTKLARFLNFYFFIFFFLGGGAGGRGGWGNVSITTFSSFSFWKSPHRRSCKIFSRFLWMGGLLSSWHSTSWLKCCNNSSFSS